MRDAPSFGVWLKHRRKALDLTQAALAQQVGCATVTIRKLEAETQPPSRQLAELLAEVLQITPTERAGFVQAARKGLSPPPLARLPIEAVQHATPVRSEHTITLTTNIPSLPTALIGRTHEIAYVCGMLRHAEIRLLTLTGPGGVGKTRLALAVADQLHDAFANGVAFIDLAPIRDPTHVIPTIAQALGVSDFGGQPLMQLLTHRLRPQHALLVIDNVEHVLAAAPELAELLAAAPQLKLLLTSRSRVGIYGEHIVAVPPLALPAHEQLPPLQELGEVAAIGLFLARARATRPEFRLTNANARTISEICHQLDGLPLALELAAARLRLLNPGALLERLSSRLRLLTGGPRDLPARQQTIRSTIDWSYQLLTPAEQYLFRQLGAFVGGWTLAAAEAVCNSQDPFPSSDPARSITILDGLQQLFDQSLIQSHELTNGERRFGMLETIREYALEQLSVHGEYEALQEQHANYYVSLAEAECLKLWTTRQSSGILDDLDHEYPNMRAALAWGQAPPRREQGLRLALALAEYWVGRSQLNEGCTWLHAMLADDPGPHDAARQSLRAKAYEWLGVFACWQVNLPAAQSNLEASLALYLELEDQRGIAEQYRSLGILAQMRGEYQLSRTLQERALAMHQQRADPHDIAWCQFFLGILEYEQDQLQRARDLMEAALSTFLTEQDSWNIASLLIHVSMPALAQGDYARVRACLVECLPILRELRERWLAAHAIEVAAGLIALRDGVQNPHTASSQAAQLFGVAEALREALGTPRMPFYERHYQQHLAAAQAHLSDLAWAAAWAHGHSLSLEQALDQIQRLLFPGAMTV